MIVDNHPDPNADPGDDRYNNLMATGAVLVALMYAGFGALESVEAVTDADGNATNQIEIGLSFMRSPYRITVERVTP